MKHSYKFEILPQDVDSERRLRLYTLENFLLNVAGKAADAQGFGIQALLPLRCTWVITRLNLEIQTLPTHGDMLRIETWVEQNAHMLSFRNYRLYITKDGREEQIGQAKSIWAVLDLDKREIVNLFHSPIFADAVDGEVLAMNKASRLTSIDLPDQVRSYIVQYSDCDYNRHCNSCKYLERMMDTLRPDFLYQPIRLDINYVREVKEGENVRIMCKKDTNRVRYMITNELQQSSCSAQIQKL